MFCTKGDPSEKEWWRFDVCQVGERQRKRTVLGGCDSRENSYHSIIHNGRLTRNPNRRDFRTDAANFYEDVYLLHIGQHLSDIHSYG
jgi:hypothetical protein